MTPLIEGLIALLLLLGRPERLQARFFTYPVDLQDDYAITLLASTISLTPGTVSAHYDAEARTLLIHALHLEDEQQAIAQIRQRYELPLKEIFRC